MTEVVEVNSLAEVLADLERRGIPEEHKIDAINHYLSLKARQQNVPANGGFELTPFCNLDCKMCYVHLRPDQLEPGQRLLTVDEWKNLIDQAVDAGMISADLTGGECLTYPGFKQIYMYLQSKGIRPTVLTNGRLLTGDMVAFFAESPPSKIQVTVYGSSNDAYERVCGYRAFDEVIAGIERAKKAGLRIHCSITPSKYMQDDIDALYQLLRSMNVQYYLGGTMLPAREETGRRLDEYIVEEEVYMSMYQKEMQYRKNKENHNMQIMVPRYLPSEKKMPKGLPCGGGHSGFHVNWKGELCPCIAFSHTVHLPISQNGFLDAWRVMGSVMEVYREPDECSSCRLRKYCMSCPGEKSMCGIDGKLNKAVCQRLRLDLERMQILNEDGFTL